MNLATKLAARAAEGRPVTVGLIGAGKFGTMFLAQARKTVGLHVVGIADLSIPRARAHWQAAAGKPSVFRRSPLAMPSIRSSPS